MSRYSGIWVWFGFIMATLSGLAGAAIVFWVIGKLPARDNLNPADYDMLTVLFVGGSPEAAPIRSENGRAIDKGVETLCTRFEKRIPYVRRWDSD